MKSTFVNSLTTHFYLGEIASCYISNRLKGGREQILIKDTDGMPTGVQSERRETYRATRNFANCIDCWRRHTSQPNNFYRQAKLECRNHLSKTTSLHTLKECKIFFWIYKYIGRLVRLSAVHEKFSLQFIRVETAEDYAPKIDNFQASIFPSRDVKRLVTECEHATATSNFHT